MLRPLFYSRDVESMCTQKAQSLGHFDQIGEFIVLIDMQSRTELEFLIKMTKIDHFWSKKSRFSGQTGTKTSQYCFGRVSLILKARELLRTVPESSHEGLQLACWRTPRWGASEFCHRLTHNKSDRITNTHTQITLIENTDASHTDQCFCDH